MDLHNSQDRNVTVQQFRFGRSLFGHGGGFDRLNAGWAVMFLDTRSFRSDAFRSALGLARDDLPGIQGNGNNRSWDLSDTVDELPSNSRAFVHHEQRKRRPAQPWPSSLGQTAVTATSSPSVVEADVLEVEMSDAASIVPSDGLDTVQDAPEEDEEEQIHSDHDDELVSDDDPDFEGTEDTVAYHALYGGKRIFANQPYFYYQSPLCQDMPCPILHASVKGA